jgi:diguanylate cyclase (GGDEF)-like protein
MNNGRTECISASIGLALYPRDGEEAEILLRHADQAMYEAKAAGRDRVFCYRGPVEKRQ